MPFKVIFFERDIEIGASVWETRAKALAYAKTPAPHTEATSVVVVDDDTNEIVFSGHVKDRMPGGSEKRTVA